MKSFSDHFGIHWDVEGHFVFALGEVYSLLYGVSRDVRPGKSVPLNFFHGMRSTKGLCIENFLNEFSKL